MSGPHWGGHWIGRVKQMESASPRNRAGTLLHGISDIFPLTNGCSSLNVATLSGLSLVEFVDGSNRFASQVAYDLLSDSASFQLGSWENGRWSIWLPTLTPAEKHKQFQLVAKSNHVLKKLVRQFDSVPRHHIPQTYRLSYMERWQQVAPQPLFHRSELPV